MNDKEKRIKHNRLIEATEKNLMGASGKLGCICRYLGEPIKGVGGALWDTYEYDFASWGEEEMDDLPTAEIDESVYTKGFLFDGLSRGMHLEIKYIADEKKLTCNYKGYEVFREVSGDLEGYAPFDEWESLIDKLYKITQTKAREKKKAEVEVKRKASVAYSKSFLQKLRERWGL